LHHHRITLALKSTNGEENYLCEEAVYRKDPVSIMGREFIPLCGVPEIVLIHRKGVCIVSRFKTLRI
jgi:hypothetical protein